MGYSNIEIDSFGMPNTDNLVTETNPDISAPDGIKGIDESIITRIWNSRIIRHLTVATGIAIAVALLVTPPGWLALGTGLFAAIIGFATFGGLATIDITYSKKSHTAEVLTFEVGAIIRAVKQLLGKPMYHKISAKSASHGAIFLGSFPTKVDISQLIKKEKVESFLSLNDDWECKPRGFFIPSHETMAAKNPSLQPSAPPAITDSIAYGRIPVKDHSPLCVQDMDTAADFIHKQVSGKKNIYVHCRAGVGRSALAISAYLIKYDSKTPEDVISLIKDKRKISTIDKKMTPLTVYESYLIKKK